MPQGATTPPVVKIEVVLEGLKQEAPDRAEEKRVWSHREILYGMSHCSKRVDDLQWEEQ